MKRDERRDHQCHKNGCDTEARWQLWIKWVSMTPAGNLERLTGEWTMKVCDRHRQWACDWFFSERQMDRFADRLERENLSIPHPSNIEVEFADLQRKTVH